jgi:hypothetical protein
MAHGRSCIRRLSQQAPGVLQQKVLRKLGVDLEIVAVSLEIAVWAPFPTEITC